MALTDKLTAIGDAIREKEGSTELIALGDMPTRILSLSTGGSGGGEGEVDAVRASVLALMENNSSNNVSFTIPAGAQKVQEYMFYGWRKLKHLVFEDESQPIIFAENAFQGCSSLLMDRFPSGYAATNIPYGCFSSCSKIELKDGLPEGITAIDNEVFRSCFNLQFTTFPESLETIGQRAFRQAFSQYNTAPDPLPPELFTIPAGVKDIQTQAFYGVGLKKIRFLGTPDSINNQAFSTSTITDIYVPWGSDFTNTMTTSAPWGATGAQIHYNVSPDEVIE